MAYTTIDWIPDLSFGEMAAARILTWHVASANSVGWDYEASVAGFESNALSHGLYKVTATAGATYDITSLSYFDPFLLRVYDQYGNCISINDEIDDLADIRLSDGGYYSSDTLWSLVAPYTGTYYIQASWNQGLYYTSYGLTVEEDRGTIPVLTLNGTSVNDTLQGTASADKFFGYGGSDTFTTIGGNDSVDGGAGIDTVVLPGSVHDYLITRAGAGATLVSSTATISLWDVERIFVGGVQVAIDVDGNAGMAYRLYQAAFNRVPDLSGLGYQMHDLDIGVSLTQVAANFIASPEFQTTYGTLNNTQFVTQLYANVLHRAPDASGLAYHVANLDAGVPRSYVLVGFSESPENKASVLGSIDHGMVYVW